MKKQSIATLLLSILFCCFLSGCAGLLKHERMDQEVEHLITALNEDDADQIFLSMYPGVITREEFDESYEAIQLLWEKSEEHTIKLNSINTKKNLDASGTSLICKARYYVYTQDNAYTITLTHLSDNSGDGLYRFDLNIGAEPVLISGGFTTAAENSALQWGILILCILSYLFIIVTAADILRKRPRLFGLWLAAALTFCSFQIRLSPSNFHAGGIINWFAMSSFKIYNNGIRNFVLSLPAGAILYWCLRKKLLAQKSKR
jgi:hypothetical protein